MATKKRAKKNFQLQKARCSQKRKQGSTTGLRKAKGVAPKRRLPSTKALRKAGLPLPLPISPGATLKAEQRKWYARLAEDGFEDLERRVDDGSMYTNYLRHSGLKGRVWSPERAQFYRLLQNYLTHHSFKKTRKRQRPGQQRNKQYSGKLDQYILERINDGWDYRTILAACRGRFKLDRSLYWMFYYVQDLVSAMVKWNAENIEGLLNPANQDQWATDALLIDLSGQGGIDSPTGLKLDQGWWAENIAGWWQANGH